MPYGTRYRTRTVEIEVIQNRILRIVIDPPWFVKNTTIHRDIVTLCQIHLNFRVRQISLTMPPIQHLPLKRRRHTDILTQQ